MYKLVTTKGNISYREYMNLQDMQKFVGGYIEKVGNVICNEEGRLNNLSKNIIDTRFVGNIIIIEK